MEFERCAQDGSVGCGPSRIRRAKLNDRMATLNGTAGPRLHFQFTSFQVHVSGVLNFALPSRPVGWQLTVTLVVDFFVVDIVESMLFVLRASIC